MKAFAMQAVLLVVAVELVALMVHQPQWLALATGVAIAVPIAGIRRMLTVNAGSPTEPAITDDLGESLRRWLSGTEARIRWAESTRTDWDRRWRPIVASRFEVSTGQRRAKDPAAYSASGTMLFGEQLWPWVDPGNVAPAGDRGPGPGRAVLEEILQRLEER